jgi:hypothetical protein
VHPFTYIVWGDTAARVAVEQSNAVRWTGAFHPAYRVLPRYRKNLATPTDHDAFIYRGADADAVVKALQQLGATIGIRRVVNDKFEDVGLILTGDVLMAAAQIPGVYTIQPVPTDGGLRGEMSDQVCANNVDGTNLAFTGYYDWLASVGSGGGSGVIMANVDGGIDHNHVDLVNRMLGCTGTTCGGSATDSHGTHTAGIMAADGTSGVTANGGFLRGLGMAPGANLVEQVYSPFFTQPGGMLLLMEDSYANGAVLSGNSWGPAGTPHGYDNDTYQVDVGVRDADPDTPGNQPFTYVLSIMNGGGGTSTQGTPDEAKNIFTIGSTKMQTSSGSQILDINDISSNSAHGPCLDGRKIPHLVAPGCSVDSTTPGNSYSANFCGTSMASPHVSGAIALFFEYYRGLPDYVTDPSPALVKAVFLPVAHDLAGNQDADGGTLGHPFDSKQGWGRMDIEAVIDPQVPVRYYDNPTVFENTGEEWQTDVTPLVPDEPMRLMLVWTDAPGHGLGDETDAWNNDLDLIVEADGDTYLGNHFGASGWSVPGGSADYQNNTEGVLLGPNAPSAAHVRVVAASINSDAIPGEGDDTDQDFALACYNCALEPGFVLNVAPTSAGACAPDDVVFDIDLVQILDFTESVTLSTAGEPAGATLTFANNPLVPPAVTTLTVSDTGSATPGHYSVTVTGTSASLTRDTAVGLDIFDSVPATPSLVDPPNSAIAVSRRPTFQWSAATQASEYKIEIATDAGFTNIVEMAFALPETTYEGTTLLDAAETYYWHVHGRNLCGSGAYSPTFSFTTQDTLPLLLVDDDDNGPDVRSTYTDTLDALGQEYDVWDTDDSDDEPDATTLSQYANVVWFTGDSFGGTAGPGSAGESALSDFLDGGGCLFITAQDYYYDRGLTTFMANYLGVADAESDVAQSTVTGAGTVFAGKGPYNLSYPFTNYSDIVAPDGTAELAFSGNEGNAAVAKDNGVYHTTFWGFPFEAIAAPADREDLMSTFLDWCSPTVTDCNGNGIPDEDDISSGTSEDCNANGVPDECEDNDCNANSVPDDCDITAGTSEDCNANGIPDECEADCNANSVPDDCDISGGTSEDCNGNTVPDECDIAGGSSADTDGNGVPDECEVNAPLVDSGGCRYLSVTADPPDSELPVAISVQSASYPCLEKYVDPSGAVSVTPVYQPAGLWGTVLVHGPDIVPGTTYLFASEVDGGPTTTPAVVGTAVWGDVVGDFVAGQWTAPNGVIDFNDISATVECFVSQPTAPSWWQCDVSPELPDGVIDFGDIGYVVDAFSANAYPFDPPCP